MSKYDYKKELKHLYLPPKGEFTIVDVQPMNFLMVDGEGNPNNSQFFQEACEALYGMAYTIKFALKPQGIEFTVPPLEGLWWAKDMDAFSLGRKDDWSWTVMIMQLEWVTPQVVEQARAELTRKKNPVALPGLRFESYHEGLSVQIMYLGAYADEGPTIAAMHKYVEERGYALRRKHHEIYLGDPRRSAPEKLKTVIRQPIEVRKSLPIIQQSDV
jgi:hypothetical protein